MQRLLVGLLTAVALLGTTRPAAAQSQTGNFDIVGYWDDRFHEDLWERRSGLELGDFTGIPFNAAGKLAASSWDPAWFAIPEEQCRPHTGIYGLRGPTAMRIWAEIDQHLGTLTAYHIYAGDEQERVIWMDNRPHPPEDAPHTFSGFSTGRWEGHKVTVKTTHVKAGYLQRNGAPHSDQATATEHFIRQGNSLLLISFIEDPIYLSEPLVKTTNWTLTEGIPTGRGRNQACGVFQIVDESGSGVDKHYVPHYLPGNNEAARDFLVGRKVPPEGAIGGAETTYPEYETTARRLQSAFLKEISAASAAARIDPAKLGFTGPWKLDRGKSSFKANWRRNGLDGLDGSAPARRELMLELLPDGSLHQTTDTQVVANDTGVFRTEFTATFDEKDVPIVGGALDTVSLKRVDALTFERTGKVKGQAAETSTWNVTPDGTTLTVTTKGRIPQPQGAAVEYSNTQVFVRP